MESSRTAPASGRLPPAAAWAAVAAGIVLARSAVFAAFDGLDFDSDQAVFGLMAKHLAEGRAFPLFMYGQSYMLAVSAWLAAPCVALLGATVFALKLPILAFNMAAAALLVVCLVRDARLAPPSALVAALPFVLPPVVTTAQLTEHCGGNVEPFLYVLLLWLLRRRAIAFGVVAGIGTLNREFTLYGVAALAVLAVASGRWRERATLRFASLAALCSAGVLAIVELVRPLSTYGRGLERAVAWKGFEAAQQRLVALVERMLGILFGFQPLALATEHLRSELRVCAAGAVLGPLLTAIAVVLLLRLLAPARARRLLEPAAALPWYLVLIGAQALAAYVLLGRGGGADPYLRYVLLALLLPIGGLALVLRLEPSFRLRALATAAACVWAAANAFDHSRLAAEYLRHPPPNPMRALADDLAGRGIRYGRADYWTAYNVSYLSGERVVLHARYFNRIGEYKTLFFDHLAEAVDVRSGDEPCEDGRRVAEFCVVGPPAPRRRGGIE